MWSEVLCLLAVVCHKHFVECGSGQQTAQELLVNWPSSGLLQGTLLHSFQPTASSQLLPHPQDCPADTFTLGGQDNANLILLRNITFEETTANPTCIRNANSAIGFTSIKTFECLALVNDTTSVISFMVNIQPEFLSTRLTFQRTFYKGWVVEGVTNTSVAFTMASTGAQTIPSKGLLIPHYRVTGEFSHLFHASRQQTGCTAVPVIQTAEPLDREARNYYEVTLEAYALYAPSLISTSTSIGICVLDANDNPPEFAGSQPPELSRLTVPVGQDSILPGTFVAQYHVTDMDVGRNGETRFSIANETDTTPFTVHPLTGRVYPFMSLTPGLSTVSIQVQDLGEPSLSSLPRSLSVFIESDNTTLPQILIHGLGQSSIQQQQVVVVSELAATGDSVITVEVVDAVAIELTVTNVGACECFNLSSPLLIPDGLRYTLIVAETLDFESTPDGHYLVVLMASSNSNNAPSLTSTLELRVEVMDENEGPSFPVGLNREGVDIMEGVPVETNVAQILASDPDGGVNGTITYSISDLVPPGLFEIDATSGLLYTLAELDAESLTSAQVTVTALDGGGLSSTMLLTLSVVDRNDNPPSFLTPSAGGQSVTISEDHPWDQHIFQFVATDADSGCNGALEYSISHAEPDAFRLDPSSGLLYPSSFSALDYESFQSATVVVRVTDLGVAVNFSVETTLRIFLTNLNDEVPVLDPIGCPCFIKENLFPSSPEASCPRLSAHDLDSTELTYEISNNAPFQIDSANGVVSPISPLDQEGESSYIVEITVSDGTHRAIPVPLTVIVVDVNDQSPTFSGELSTFTVPTDTPPGDFVGSLAATDSDVGYNALTNHVMASGTSAEVMNTFRLDPLSGELYTKAPLSASTTYTFTISAHDVLNTAGERLSVRVIIQQSGLKNNPPWFALSTDRRTVCEDLRPSFSVAQITASDDDTGANGDLTYSLVEESSNHSGLFQLQPNGLLVLAQSISNRAGNIYHLNVSACDGGAVPLKAYQLLEVTVYPRISGSLVYNQNIPVCSYNGLVVEELDNRASITRLQPALELSSADITYTVVSLGEESRAFEVVQRSGDVFLESRGGFRNIFMHREAIFITLLAEYNLNFHLCSVTVAVEDINNNPPVLDGGYSFEVYNRTPSGSAVYQVTASDADKGSNVIALYAITNTEQVPFEIDGNTGIISVTGVLDRPSYAITVTATDSTLLPPASTTVTATVLGTSNFSPVFTSPPNSTLTVLTVPETTRGFIAATEISDGDGDLNRQATNSFCIASGNLHGAFSISRLGGQLIATDGLDFEALPHQLDLTLMAYDSSLNPAFGTTQVRLVVQDKNEPPVFSVPVYRASVLEGTGEGVTVINVTATDSDAGEDGEVTYSIPNDVPFSIDSQSGAIKTAGTLARVNRAVIVFNVTASDRGTLSMTSEAEVEITLTDINDIVPMFDIGNTLTVPENTEVGSEILLLTAIDGDVGVNQQLQFTVVSGDDTNRFSLDPWTGSLTVVQSLDSGNSPHVLELRVQDLGTPQRISDLFQLTIVVTDSNDHFPLFSSAEYECNIAERASTFTQTCQVIATDSDQTGAQVSYSLVGSSLFSIDPDNGVISVTGGPVLGGDREESPAHILQVSATDAHPAGRRTSIAIVRVIIIDANDVPVPESDQFTLYEGTPLNTLLFYAHLHDQDTPTNLSVVTYGVIEGGDVIRVEEHTGAVFLNRELDSVVMPGPISLDIIGTNSRHSPPTSSLSRYTVDVVRGNQNTLPPVFLLDSNPSGVWVSRASIPGTSVVTLTATDPEAQSLRYDITGGSGLGYFQIDPISGEVTTAFSLTAVESSELTVEVRVLDSVLYPLPAWHELTITLSSETSSKPFFTRPVFTASPSEDTTGVIAAVRATVDGEVDSSICYSIQSGNNDQIFSIDRQTGAITMAGSADREVKPLHLLAVRADQVGVNETSTALMVVELEDANDNRPSISDGRFNFTVFETFPVGVNETVVRVFAVDNDAGENRRLTYSIVATIPSNSPFAISSDTGDLYLVRSLDRSEAIVHAIVVAARDNIIQGTGTVMVTVEPAPVSPLAPILNTIPSISLRENSPPGQLLTTVTLLNAELASDLLIYRIVERESVVAILPNSGQVYLIKTVDFEEASRLSYTVEVLGGTTPITTPLMITVTNENDNRPVFDRPVFAFDVNENLSVPHAIQRVMATDRDNGDVLTYTLVDSLHPSSLGLFTVRESDGLVSVSANGIDREAFPTHTLTVSVSDNGATPLVDYARVVITIQDVNDHTPQFIPSNVAAYVSEDSMPQEVMHTVKAFDPDGGSNADIAYTLLTADSPFALESATGEIRLTTPLDAEFQLVHRLEVRAFNPNNPSGSFSATNLNLTVLVVPVLDSAPELVPPPTASIRENYPTYSRVARVQSLPSNRQVYYSIVAGNDLNHFLVEPLTGVVRTTTPLNREEVASYQLVIQGSFGAGFKSNVTFLVSVMDINDESPRFSAPFLRVAIPENSPPGQPLASVSVVDSDEGESGMISAIVILDGLAASYFSIDSSGNILLNQNQELDREGKFSSLIFQICAIDSGTPTQYSTTELQIDITDANDPPQFEDITYTFIVSTPVLIGVPQFRVRALDADIGTNGDVTYSLSGGGGDETFSINTVTGELSVDNNYMIQERSLTVTATDGGGAATTAQLDILVSACNFRNLTFGPRSAMISEEILENATASTIIVTGSDWQVIDLQEQSVNVRFSLPLETTSFGINNQTGDIFVVALDRENRSEHRLIVQATDVSDASRIAQTQVVVTVRDVNDNSPEFTPSVYSFSVTATNDSSVRRVTATDRDEGTNAEITYSLVSNPSNFFTIDAVSGFLFFSPSDVSQLGSIVQLVVRATDRGENRRSADATVFINVVDPTAPTFEQEVYSVRVAESTPSGTVLVNVTLEASSQAEIVSFRIENTEPVPFSVSPSGSVTLVDPGVDYEIAAQRNYNFRVRARNDVSGLIGFTLVTVDVTDSNDNAPVFEPSSVYGLSVMENATTGTTILQVGAVDADSTPNAAITYELQPNTPSQLTIDSSTGEIFLGEELDHEQAMSYEFEVLAEDSGSPTLTATARVFLTITNINDNRPTFSQLQYETFIRDNDQPGPTNLFVSASDPDDLGNLVYDIVDGPGSGDFSVSDNGRINLIASPVEVSYTLNVSAFDGMFYGYTTVEISVEGINANSPVFNSSNYIGTVQENPEGGVVVVQVFATDADRGTNGLVTYHLHPSESCSSCFTIDSTTGVITTTTLAATIDREATPTLTIVAIAMDGGSLSTIAEVAIVIGDQNDNAPFFNVPEYYETLVTRSEAHTEVLTVMAFDPDIGENSRLTYSIVNGDGQLIFLINAVTGVITNFVAPDNTVENSTFYSFNVGVHDNGSPMLTAEATTRVVIEIVDTNQPSFEQRVYSVRVLENARFGTTVLELRLDPNTTSVCDMFGPLVVSDNENRFVPNGNSIETASTDLTPTRTYQVFVRRLCISFQLGITFNVTATVNILVEEVNDPPTVMATLR